MEEIGRELERREIEVPPNPPRTFPEVNLTSQGPNDYYYIQSDLPPGLYVTISSSDGIIPKSGDGIIMAHKNNSDNQKWLLEPATSETVFFSISKPKDGTRLALDGGAMTVGTQIKVTPYIKSNPSQKWKRDNKYLQMNNGKVMDVQGGGTSDGTPVILWNKKSKPGNKNQQFSLIKVGDAVKKEEIECSAGAADMRAGAADVGAALSSECSAGSRRYESRGSRRGCCTLF